LTVFEQSREGVVLSVRLQPRAAKNEISGIVGDTVKVKVSSAPVEGAANEACRHVLAKAMGIGKGRVQIISGLKSRHKKVLLIDIDKETAASRLHEMLQQAL